MSSKTSRLLKGPASLEPRKNVVRDGDSYSALTEEPWLAIVSPTAFVQTGFLEVAYSTEFYAPPVRPILRFWIGTDRFQDHIAPAPINGAGRWIGRAPRGCTDVWVSPTNRPGKFRFSISMPRRAPYRELFRRLCLAPKRVFFALAAGWVGLEEEAALNWRWALGNSPLRPLEWSKEAPLAVPVKGAGQENNRFTILVDVTGASAVQIDDTCASIERQSLTSRRALLLGEPSDALAIERKAAWEKHSDFRGGSASLNRTDGELMIRLTAGDTLVEHALSCFDAHFAGRPEQKLAYADEIHSGPQGERFPSFKPGWSPTLQQSTRYIGRAAAFRAYLLDGEADWACAPAEDLVDRLASRLALNEVGALPLPLFNAPVSPSPFFPQQGRVVASRPTVSIVIPTRDRADLLRRCLVSLFEKTTYGSFDVLLVDNESVEPRTLALMKEMRASYERLQIIRIPGDFNFSALSNAGAAACSGEYLLFLNNDTRIITPDWIERLLFFATQSEIGAVGAKLLYPNRKVQHVGVLLGMGGVAGHFGAGLDETEPGWLRRNLVAHEVSAVTGACLMVSRTKFDAVGRFDETNLPVDLNDVDLCLRLGERGWRTICNSEVVLVHHQSASRGGGLRLQQVYERERRFFVERWRATIRDDPYFHPGLSLYSPTVMLP
ncbi:glycosyltransferase family 2 protein [Methylocystis sp. JAN1]|uniref:glycosyltransferase family 2 protein n=1 Tax=Methylocystis sp. JAN1 TaxID=3397211 RepID=UPI003FA1EF3C